MKNKFLFFQILVLLIALVTIGFFVLEDIKLINDDIADKDILPIGTSIARASGQAHWLYMDDHGLSEEEFGTPQDPKGLDAVPLENRKVDESGAHYSGLKDGMIFSRDRANVSGSIEVKVKDVTAVDMNESLDEATATANFSGPNGESFKVILHDVRSKENGNMQTFGGVGLNSLIHGHSGSGVTKLFSEFAYVVVFGSGDIYRDDKLIAENVFIYIAASQRARVLREDAVLGHYNYSDPLGKLILHLVILPQKISANGTFEFFPIPTGVIDQNGQEQVFFHINYLENISIEGNQFIK